MIQYPIAPCWHSLLPRRIILIQDSIVLISWFECEGTFTEIAQNGSDFPGPFELVEPSEFFEIAHFDKPPDHIVLIEYPVVKISQKHLHIMTAHLVIQLLCAPLFDEGRNVHFGQLICSFLDQVLTHPAFEVAIDKAKRGVQVQESDKRGPLVSHIS